MLSTEKNNKIEKMMLEEIGSLNILNSIQEGIVVIDRNGIILFANEFWEKFTEDNGFPLMGKMGYNYVDIILRKVGKTKESDELRKLLVGLQKIINKRLNFFEGEYPFGENDKKIYLRVIAFPLAGNPDRLVLNHNNITGKRQLEKRLRDAEEELQSYYLEASLGSMIAAISHDFNNLLATLQSPEVIGIAVDSVRKELASQNLPPDFYDRIGRYLNKISQLADSFSNAVKTAFLWSKTITEPFTKKEKEKKSESVSKISSAILDIVRTEMERNRIELISDIDQSAPLVLCNGSEMMRVIFNLVFNAIQSMSSSIVRTLSFHLWHDDKNVFITIADTGTGIDPEAIPYVFDKFITNKAGEGVGIGLYTVKRIVESIGGEIVLESVKGKGTNVRLVLPAEVVG